MSDLLVDLGNSRLKWVLRAALPGAARSVPAAALPAALDREWGGLSAPARVVAASVAPGATWRMLEDWVIARWGVRPVLVRSSAEQLGVRNGYRSPQMLGSDRWAALIGAHGLMTGPLCVVDCGTAVTLDALAADGTFVGGAIFPGLALLRASLVTGTGGVREVEGDAHLPGRSTAEGVNAGTLYGLAGAIRHIIAFYRRQLGGGLTLIMTGGDAPRLIPYLELAVRHEPELVLLGLARIADATA